MSSLYFNNAFAKRPLDAAVRAMLPFLRENFENPLTESDQAECARVTLEGARERAAALLQARAGEIVFVSSGTEANNWALKGAAWGSEKRHIVISAIEHFSAYQSAAYLARHGYELTVVPVDGSGLVDPADVLRAVGPDTLLVSVIAGSDEIGVIQDLAGICEVKQTFPEVLLHTDAVQYLCYEDIDVQRLPFDLVSFSSNALYGPAGIAALYIREGTRMVPLLHGGMQEGGLRPGLQSLALAAGFGAAAAENARQKKEWKRAVRELQGRLFEALDQLGVPVTGSRRRRLADNAHAIFEVDGEALLTLLLEDGIRASSGSTCYQFAQKESHVLKALGIEQTKARGAVLFTLGFDQSGQDVSILADTLQRSARHLASLKPRADKSPDAG